MKKVILSCLVCLFSLSLFAQEYGGRGTYITPYLNYGFGNNYYPTGCELFLLDEYYSGEINNPLPLRDNPTEVDVIITLDGIRTFGDLVLNPCEGVEINIYRRPDVQNSGFLLTDYASEVLFFRLRDFSATTFKFRMKIDRKKIWNSDPNLRYFDYTFNWKNNWITRRIYYN